MIELDRFKIIEKIGEGSMGEVYKAHQISMDRTVAVKVLDPELAEDEVFAERFLHEARSIGKLNHPNIVQGIDFGQSEKNLYFVMEYVEGPSLYEILKQGPLEEDEVLEIGLQVARALEHGHVNGIIHRDIKPGNIMISTEGIAKVTDYGLAKRDEGSSKKSTAAGRVMGTPYYISPEQARGEENIDIRSDIYSLGATLYHAATGKPPFPGKNAPDIMSKTLNDPFPDPRIEKSELTAAFAKLVMKLTQKDKAKRPADPAKLIQEVERIMRASAAERQRQSIGANLRRTLRRVVTKADEGRQAMPQKAKLAIAGITAVAVVVILLVIVLPGFKKERQNPRQGKKTENNQAARTEKKEPVKEDTSQTREDYVEKQVREAEEELAKEARDAYLQAEAFARGSNDIHEAITRLHQVAASYGGAFGDKAKKLAQKLQHEIDGKATQELNRCKLEAAKALAAMNYGAAARAYEGFDGDLARTSAGEEAHRLRKEILEQARSSYERLRNEAEKLAREGNFDDAVKLYEKALGFGVSEIKSQAQAKISRLKKDMAVVLAREEGEKKRRIKQLYDVFYPEYAGLIDKKDFNGARQCCDTVLADNTRKDIHEIVGRHLADIEMVLKVQNAANEAAKNLKLQTYTFELQGGRTVKGLVKDFNNGVLDVELSNMKGAILGVEISRLTGGALVKLALRMLGDTPQSHLACGVFLLFAGDDGAEAVKEFALAAKGGLDISRYDKKLASLKQKQFEEEAGKLFGELIKLVKRRKWKQVTEIAEKLTKKYEKSKVVETSRMEIEKTHTLAVLKLAQEDKTKTTKKDKMLPGLIGTYYNGRNFDEQKARRIDSTVNFDWGDRNPHPDVRRNNFSVRWEGFIAIPRSGRYTLIFNSNDGCRMWLAGQELFNDWRGRGATDSSKDLTLKKEVYPIKIEYFESGGAASAKLLWSVGGQRQVIPAEYLFHSKTQGKP
jgi:serine/threonine-protein kinase